MGWLRRTKRTGGGQTGVRGQAGDGDQQAADQTAGQATGQGPEIVSDRGDGGQQAVDQPVGQKGLEILAGDRGDGGRQAVDQPVGQKGLEINVSHRGDGIIIGWERDGKRRVTSYKVRSGRTLYTLLASNRKDFGTINLSFFVLVLRDPADHRELVKGTRVYFDKSNPEGGVWCVSPYQID